MKKFILVCILFLAFLSNRVHADASEDPQVAFQKYTLKNGLEVILHQDKSVPIVAVDVWYHVGSGDETPGKSGFAHLFEHMLFQGSKHVGEDKHFDILRNVGSTEVNGTTNLNRTNYYEVVPSHQIETALWLESDRMGYLLPLLNQKSLANQIEVVRNEKRQRYDNVPYGKTHMKIFEMLFPDDHPYKYRTIGKHTDLTSATLTDVIAFYKTWYAPANATLAISGDFEIDVAKGLIEKWFGSFPASERPRHEARPLPVVNHQRQTIEDEFVDLTRLNIAWVSPPLYQEGDAEMDIVASALGNQGTGRLYKRLVLGEQLAKSVFVYQSSATLASVFNVVVTLQKGADITRIETIVNEELEKITTKPITDKEFNRAVIQFESQFVWGLESLLRRAEMLQGYNHFWGDPKGIKRDLDRYRQSSPQKVLTFCQNVLGSKNKIEIITKPKSKPKPVSKNRSKNSVQIALGGN